MEILSNKTHIIGGSVIVAVVMFFLLIIAWTVQGESGVYDQVLQNRENLIEAQKNALAAHATLAKAIEATKAAEEAERQAQSVVDGYTATATTARQNICNLGKEFCTRENLDPLGTATGSTLDAFFTQSR